MISAPHFVSSVDVGGVFLRRRGQRIAALVVDALLDLVGGDQLAQLRVELVDDRPRRAGRRQQRRSAAPTSKPGSPDSSTVGTSGSRLKRSVAVHGDRRAACRPARLPIAGGSTPNATGTWPPSRSFISGAVPL